ncbi:MULTISPECIES: TMEM165/GDT1 family protein [unclassified Prochlorococcus]|uniref:TMEM165/GDT1 family protein n=1 Tax=unclassified Prochlorococcus TaxID=2627481 RepID=UPI000533A992|nr:MULTISPECIES: TMEM165/GDT1 family protein [unclassified Prochlorococcus]KGG15305.1 hypothetical protein EV06_1176 [Prochlorococcus sp. MIT 0602]KGG17584.1 hypothetical protein EV07_1024 [Prochlorococcus sp. MIT 0603]
MSNNSSDMVTKKPPINNNESYLTTLLTTFVAVFFAEIGDKTQIATLLLSADTGKPLIVFVAATSALILTSLIGVLIGSFISSRVNPVIFKRVAGTLMIIIGLLIIIHISTNIDFFIT